MLIQELIEQAMPPMGSRRPIMDAITLLGGESKRLSAGLSALMHRHGANIELAYRSLSKNEGVYIVYSDGGTWRPRQIELQWPTVGGLAFLFVTSNSAAKGRAYRYIIPKSIAADPFNMAVLHYGDYVHIDEQLYDDSYKVDWTFDWYPEYEVDPREYEERCAYSYGLFESFLEDAEYYTQSDNPYMLNTRGLYTMDFPRGEHIDTLEGYGKQRGAYFYIRHRNGEKSPIYYWDGYGQSYINLPVELPYSGGYQVEVDTSDCDIFVVEGTHLRAHAAKVERMRRRIESQPHKNVTRALEDWEMMLVFEHFAPRPHGFGSYVDKWLS